MVLAGLTVLLLSNTLGALLLTTIIHLCIVYWNLLCGERLVFWFSTRDCVLVQLDIEFVLVCDFYAICLPNLAGSCWLSDQHINLYWSSWDIECPMMDYMFYGNAFIRSCKISVIVNAEELKCYRHGWDCNFQLLDFFVWVFDIYIQEIYWSMYDNVFFIECF